MENRPGANGSIAAEALARSPADGYDHGRVDGTFAINMGLYKNPVYTLRDFDAITVASAPPNVLIAAEFPANSVREFIDYARTQPGQVSHGSSGSGSWITCRRNSSATDQDIRRAFPYRGGAAAGPT